MTRFSSRLLSAWLAAGILGMPTWPGALPPSLYAQRLSPLAPPPNWSDLDAYQETITREEFARLLDQLYAPQNAAAGLIEVGDSSAIIRTNLTPGDTYTLRFAPRPAEVKAVPRYWRPVAAALTGASPEKPLTGLKVVIDPGHLGGNWAKLEERWFQIGEGTLPVTEGDLTLRVAHLLAPQLRRLGAEVTLVREVPEPTTAARPATLLDVARSELALEGRVNPPETYSGPEDPLRAESVQFRSELLFFRNAEIRERARLINEQYRPDLVLCLHFDADAWGDPKAPAFTPFNRLHSLLNGTYGPGELRQDDVRHDMLLKLLERSGAEELAANGAIVRVLARRMALPPYIYNSPAARRPRTSPYVWARNLLANRLYRCPVVFLEPYAMNSREVWERVQAGDYEGEREVAGSVRPSIFREYADAVREGVEAYGRQSRAAAGYPLVPK